VLIREVMTTPPLHISPQASMEEAALLFAGSEASDLMVAAEDGRLVGVLSEGDLLRAVLPDRAEIEAAGGSVEDAMIAFVRKGVELRSRPVGPYVIREPITVDPDDHVSVAAVVMTERFIRRLPVVRDGLLVGTVSRSALCRAVLSTRQRG
jgi:CBS domain-containing protein